MYNRRDYDERGTEFVRLLLDIDLKNKTETFSTRFFDFIRSRLFYFRQGRDAVILSYFWQKILSKILMFLRKNLLSPSLYSTEKKKNCSNFLAYKRTFILLLLLSMFDDKIFVMIFANNEYFYILSWQCNVWGRRVSRFSSHLSEMTMKKQILQSFERANEIRMTRKWARDSFIVSNKMLVIFIP